MQSNVSRHPTTSSGRRAEGAAGVTQSGRGPTARGHGSVRGRVALVTGASAGIGEACARRLAADGARVVLWARRLDRLHSLAGTIDPGWAGRNSSGAASEGSPVAGVASVDVRDRAAVFAEARRLADQGTIPDIVVNNAGLAAGLAPVAEGDPDNWDRMIDTNVKGLLFVMRAFLPHMLRRGSGHIINIGSIAGRQVYPDGNVYCASKFAVRAITEGASQETLGTGVRVSAVNPGLAETEFSIVRFAGDSQRASSVYDGIRALSGDDVADVVAYVAAAPPHVNVADVLVLPSAQAGAHHVYREPGE
ncbi:MAG: SDR family NAD(P)-dependent oxidoreductase [Gemmatimonadetes bacterium]|nr:SDR family NAD(P)-dependent oxidoreductase [Gemmatimonadota bacterium]